MNKNDNDFFTTLRKRINQYFIDNNLSMTGNGSLYFKTVFLISTAILLYLTIMLFPALHFTLQIALCGLLGVNFALIGFNIMHDGAHGSYSSKPWVNHLMGYTINFLGANSFLWRQKHNINHHTYTNMDTMDEDMDIEPFMRMNEYQKKSTFHKFQHIYALFFYSFTYFVWVWYQDFKKYFFGKISGESIMKRMSFKDHLVFWSSKTIYTTLILVIPIFIHGWISTIVGYVLMAAITGIVLAIVFQLAHINEATQFYLNNSKNETLKTEWAIYQLNTTANFATENRLISWLLGGLNFQVEHHLFPKISHVHYPAIKKIVRETCEEFKVNYKEYKTLFGALKSHFMHLKQIGVA